MTRARGNVLQNSAAGYLVVSGFPHAESAGAGRQGTDILGTPGIVWECKTAFEFKRDFRAQQWVAQAKHHAANGEVPVVVYFPPGIGAANTGNALAIVPLHVQVQLLREAGYC